MLLLINANKMQMFFMVYDKKEYMKHDLKKRKEALDYYLTVRREKKIGESINIVAAMINVSKRTLWGWKKEDKWDLALSEQVESEYKSRHIIYEDFEVIIVGITLAIRILGRYVNNGEDKIILGKIMLLFSELFAEMVRDTYTYPKHYRMCMDRFLEVGFSKEELDELNLMLDKDIKS